MYSIFRQIHYPCLSEKSPNDEPGLDTIALSPHLIGSSEVPSQSHDDLESALNSKITSGTKESLGQTTVDFVYKEIRCPSRYLKNLSFMVFFLAASAYFWAILFVSECSTNAELPGSFRRRIYLVRERGPGSKVSRRKLWHRNRHMRPPGTVLVY